MKGDYDGDGDEDLYLVNYAGDARLLRNDQPGPSDSYNHYSFDRAVGLSLLEDDLEQTLALLQRGLDQGYLVWGLLDGKIFEDVRNHPDYALLEAKANSLVEKHLARLAELD